MLDASCVRCTANRVPEGGPYGCCVEYPWESLDAREYGPQHSAHTGQPESRVRGLPTLA
jgi:hypothetical protein